MSFISLIELSVLSVISLSTSCHFYVSYHRLEAEFTASHHLTTNYQQNGGHCQPLLLEHPRDPSIGHFEFKNLRTIQSLVKERNIDCEFHEQPSVRAIYSAFELAEAASHIAALRTFDKELGSHVKITSDPNELKRLRIPTAIGATVTDAAARMWPYKFVARILEDLLTSTKLSGTFGLHTFTPVTSIEPQASFTAEEDKYLVHTDRGMIRARSVVLATNGYTSHLAPWMADNIVPCKAQMSALTAPPAVSGANRLNTSYGFMSTNFDDYLIQRPSDRGEQLMFGGGRQFGDNLGNVDDSTINEETKAYLQRELVTRMKIPNMNELKVENMWTGIQGWSRDNHPWVGAVPGKSGLFMAAGYTGHGMPNTWLAGKSVAVIIEHAAAAESDEDCTQAAIDKVGLPASYAITEDRLAQAKEMVSQGATLSDPTTDRSL